MEALGATILLLTIVFTLNTDFIVKVFFKAHALQTALHFLLICLLFYNLIRKLKISYKYNFV